MQSAKDCAWTNLSRRMLALERYIIEIVLTVGSVWAFYVLITPPSNFAAFPASFAFALEIGDEHLWAEFVLVGALLKAIGLSLLWAQNGWLQGASIGARCVGLGFSGMFWTTMALSAIAGNPDSLFGFLGLLFGFSAWWTLLRFPTLPRQGPR